MTAPFSGRPRGRPPYPLLTPAEERVLQHLRQGLTNAEIAAQLGVSPDAVKYHVSNMLGKLGLENREQLGAWHGPSLLGRAWAGVASLGWRVVAGGAAAGVVAATIAAIAILRDDSMQPPLQFVTLGIGPMSVFQAVVSADGNWIAYSAGPVPGPAAPPGQQRVYLLERATGKTVLVSRAISGDPNGESSYPAVSADGRFVAFQSVASNLVPGDTNGEPADVESRLPDSILGSMGSLAGESRDRFMNEIGGSDIFLFDRDTGGLTRVSVSSRGEQGNWGSRRPAITADGAKLAFESLATNLVPEDTNIGRGSTRPFALGGSDIFVRDIADGTTTRASVAQRADEAQGSSAEPYLSAAGGEISFISDALNFPAGSHSVMKGYLRDGSAETRLISVPLSGSEIPQQSIDTAPRISADGNLLVFAAVNYWTRRSGVYVYNRGASSTVELWSDDLERWPQHAYHAAMSPDGSQVVFLTSGLVVRLYDTRTAHMTPLAVLPGQASSLSVSNTGVLVIAGQDGIRTANIR